MRESFFVLRIVRALEGNGFGICGEMSDSEFAEEREEEADAESVRTTVRGGF